MADHISEPIASLTVHPDADKHQFPRCQRYSPNFEARRTGATIMPEAPMRILEIDRLDVNADPSVGLLDMKTAPPTIGRALR